MIKNIRQPTLVKQNLIGAVDIGGTKIAVGLSTHQGEIIARRDLTTRDYANGATGVAAIRTTLQACLNETGKDMCGIGVACTGPVYPLSGTIGKVANLQGWEGCRITEDLTLAFGVSAVMENDADAAALAESLWGVGQNVERLLYLTFSTGIGAGFVLDGRLYRGSGGSHPEIGHHCIDPTGPLCYCGAHGCWESLASGSAVRDWFLENDRLRRYRKETLDARIVFGLYDQGDLLAQEAVARLSRNIAIGLANATTILLPDVIVVGGGLMSRADIFLPQAEAQFRRICGEVPAENTRICPAAFQHNSGLTGAAAAWVLAEDMKLA